ncbi:MAG TPA: hypothetical protein VKB79_06570 [Bryobacteraceae bacterium]|nr:hypothetical protein [Bryobacteraceae bacterium]
MPRKLTSAATLDNLKREAKRWLKALRESDADARERFNNAYPNRTSVPVLRDVQHALAREYGFENWNELKRAIQQSARSRTAQAYEQAAHDFVEAYKGDAAALEHLNAHYGRAFTLADVKAEIWHRDYAYRQRSSRVPENYFPIEEARVIVAQDAGFGSWEKLIEAAATGTPPQGPPYALQSAENRIGPRRRMSAADWDELIGVMRERRIPSLEAHGLITDDALTRISALDFVTDLDLSGSRELTDEGLSHLARMPQLERLSLNEYPGGKLTDRGLEVLRHLPNLRKFAMTWQAGITDRGTANLRFCDHLEEVSLMGSPTGDGAIEALQGKPNLRRFSTGKLVTDEGIALLRNFPLLKSAEGQAKLLIDGPFTNAGFAALRDLDGLFELDLFWHVNRITTDSFAHLVHLLNLTVLGCDGALSDDIALTHIAAMPSLKRLRVQESIATEDGFVALARSQTIESIWGRVCENFGSRGFVAFSKMPSLRNLGIGCANVEEAALAILPDFPSLRELTPIGFQDDGFRHIGRCRNLERLTCMYCRATGDAATEHIRDLAIRYYYAGLTQITDRSLEILSGIESLEQIELYECLKVTDTGLPHLALLPALREVHLNHLPGVTFEGTKIFGAGVSVHYST